jgi:hypothetical protein
MVRAWSGSETLGLGEVKRTMEGWQVMDDGVIAEFRERKSTASMHSYGKISQPILGAD